MELLWFYIAIVLAISDELHSIVMWNFLHDFYIIFGGLVQEMVYSNFQAWLVHEGLEAVFHFFVLSIVFFSLEIGFLGGLIHFVIDVIHSLTIKHMTHLEHRSLHFVFESLFFMCIFGF
ncbi:hypothetical protein MBBAR_6c00280 [Methanobrevibacter arboriphilus JCM 13429 = DSM 1125]|uniref:Uncharacterized protein n=1 Tax=Methanobrevibacter arboriphilus JCM 13429 = DSM 1125 TaxID=1300164 RepID=A0A1V6N2J2_METAZ|nr:hypothetical protein [Methanobrevibacter arboriphilus]OQD58918.1 hypothetical protein MBBAR_6c00280 [Methanobrevibacter arboriphilus JCM 13429 = DSM 1125]